MRFFSINQILQVREHKTDHGYFSVCCSINWSVSRKENASAFARASRFWIFRFPCIQSEKYSYKFYRQDNILLIAGPLAKLVTNAITTRATNNSTCIIPALNARSSQNNFHRSSRIHSHFQQQLLRVNLIRQHRLLQITNYLSDTGK